MNAYLYCYELFYVQVQVLLRKLEYHQKVVLMAQLMENSKLSCA